VPLRDYWIDPDPAVSAGLLLSDRILFYCQRVLLVWPYDQRFIEPASYTLHAGREYLVSTESGQIESRNLEIDGKVIVPPNGLIYIQFFEEVNLPHYMIARFNLRVSQVYRGLLLGTGPQVDPGFRGRLGCPIHNFTDRDKTIEFGDDLATIDFQKTTPLGETYWPGMNVGQIADRDFEAMRAGVTPIGGLNGAPCKIFNKRNNVVFASYLPAGQSVRSSVAALNTKVDNAQREVDLAKKQIVFYRRVGLGALGALLVGLVTLFLTVALPLYTNVKDDISNRYMNLKADVVELARAVARLEARESARPSRSGRDIKAQGDKGQTRDAGGEVSPGERPIESPATPKK